MKHILKQASEAAGYKPVPKKPAGPAPTKQKFRSVRAKFGPDTCHKMYTSERTLFLEDVYNYIKTPRGVDVTWSKVLDGKTFDNKVYIRSDGFYVEKDGKLVPLEMPLDEIIVSVEPNLNFAISFRKMKDPGSPRTYVRVS